MKNMADLSSSCCPSPQRRLPVNPRVLSQQAMESVQQQTSEMSALGIPEAQAQKMLTQMVQNRLQKQNRVRAQQVVVDTAKAGLPTEPVMSKAMEGMAKQAGEQQIIAAMETVQSRYAHASRKAKALSDDNESIATMTRDIADSMAAGMKAEDIEPVMAQLQVRTRNRQQTRNKAEDDELAVQTMQTVRTMARLGVPPADVSDTLCQALQNRYTYQEMKQLRHQIAKQAHQTTPADCQPACRRHRQGRQWRQCRRQRIGKRCRWFWRRLRRWRGGGGSGGGGSGGGSGGGGSGGGGSGGGGSGGGSGGGN
jgi:hypothetical protein